MKTWQQKCAQLITKFNKALLLDEFESDSKSNDENKTIDESALDQHRFIYYKDFNKQLYSDIDDKSFFAKIKINLKRIENRIEEVSVILQHLEMALINISCDDPGSHLFYFSFKFYFK